MRWITPFRTPARYVPHGIGVAAPRRLTLIATSLTAPLVVGAAATLGPLPGLGAVSAVGVGLVVLDRPAYGAYGLVALAPVL